MKITRTKSVKANTDVTAARVGKTKEVIVLQGNYGYGWDDLVEYESNQYGEAKQDIKDYRENERNARHRIIRRRVPNPNWVDPTNNDVQVESSTSTKRKYTVKASVDDEDTGFSKSDNLIYDREQFVTNLVHEIEDEYRIKVSNDAWGEIMDLARDLSFGKDAERHGSTPQYILEDEIYNIVEKDTGIVIGSTDITADSDIEERMIQLDNQEDLVLIGDKIASWTGQDVSVYYADFTNQNDWTVFIAVEHDMAFNNFMEYILQNHKDMYNALHTSDSGIDDRCIDAMGWDCELTPNGPILKDGSISIRIDRGYDRSLVDELRKIRNEYADYVVSGLKESQSKLGNYLAEYANLYASTDITADSDTSTMRDRFINPDDFVFFFNGEELYRGDGDGFSNVIADLCKDESTNQKFQDWCNQYGDPIDFDGTPKDTAYVFTWLVDQERMEQDDFYLDGSGILNFEMCDVSGIVESSTDITAAIGRPNESDDKEYYTALADGVVNAYTAYWNAEIEDMTDLTYEISDSAITFIDNGNVIYIQPTENITPNWDDLDSDIEELSNAVIGSNLSF